MKTTPISFGSVMVFNLKDDRPREDLSILLTTAFRNNPKLINFDFVVDPPKDEYNQINGAYVNASPNYANWLDMKYREQYKSNPKTVVLSSAMYITPYNKKQKRYFLTAMSEEKENVIHGELSKGLTMYAVKFDLIA